MPENSFSQSEMSTKKASPGKSGRFGQFKRRFLVEIGFRAFDPSVTARIAPVGYSLYSLEARSTIVLVIATSLTSKHSLFTLRDMCSRAVVLSTLF